VVDKKVTRLATEFSTNSCIFVILPWAAVSVKFDWRAVILTYVHPTVPPEKLTDPQLLKKFTAFYGTQRFITAFTTAHLLSLS
jgi:hypothetical protein